MQSYNRPKVGVGVIVLKDNRILLGKRKGSHGAGTWCFPGGHLEFGEEIFDCAVRETKEEAGIEIENLKLGPYTNDYNRDEETHYITLFVTATYKSGETVVCEPFKCEEWRWCGENSLPTPLFLPTQNFFNSGFSPFHLSTDANR